MVKNRVQTCIRLTPELLHKISYVARENYRSLNGQVKYLVMRCTEEFEAKFGEIPVDMEKSLVLLYHAETGDLWSPVSGCRKSVDSCQQAPKP